MCGLRTRYSTDLSDPEWEILCPLVPAVRPGGRPAKHSRREIVNALAYWLRAGCFPPDLLVRTLVLLQHDLLERLLPARRLRSQPRVIKRKMSNYRLKWAEHHTWPQPTRTGTRAITIQRPQPANP
ncbi:transposase [Streptomyces sp. NBC_00203]|uniref:transposase n=1 Tax=Streptomyces sp. NBC_00203 TaxID=2975680 RepID=UPI00386D5A14